MKVLMWFQCQACDHVERRRVKLPNAGKANEQRIVIQVICKKCGHRVTRGIQSGIAKGVVQ